MGTMFPYSLLSTTKFRVSGFCLEGTRTLSSAFSLARRVSLSRSISKVSTRSFGRREPNISKLNPKPQKHYHEDVQNENMTSLTGSMR